MKAKGYNMDWIKVLNKHILLEYSDLRDSEFVAWIKIMALTAQLEHEPSREQILKYVNYQTLNSLSSKLQKHSIDLPSILHKVLIDASYVRHRQEQWKTKKQQYRADIKSVSKDVSKDVSSKDKEKEIDKEKDKNNVIKKEKTIPPTIEEVRAYCTERNNHVDAEAWLAYYNSNGWMIGKNKMKDWKSAIITWEKRGGNGNERGTGTFGSARTPVAKAGRAKSDGAPYPVDAEC